MANILDAQVTHKRHSPKVNQFRYSVYYLAFSLQNKLPNYLILSINRWNFFSLFSKDRGARDTITSWYDWVQSILKQQNIQATSVTLVTMPRILGYAFNPVSFWLCHDGDNNLKAVLAEVNNTFKQHHSYLLYNQDGSDISQDQWLSSDKHFHVSPFYPVEGEYQFRFVFKEHKIAAWINYYNKNQLQLETSLVGNLKPLSSCALVWRFVRYPLVTLKVVYLIHYQALKLLSKGANYHSKPSMPKQEITFCPN